MPNSVIDSNMSFEEAIRGTGAPKDVVDKLILVDVRYLGVDGNVHHGQIMVDRDIENLTKMIFYKLLESKFAIEKCIPMSFYDWDDDKAMNDNNTSGFCYKRLQNGKLSRNSSGFAFDINPRFNPIMMKDGRVIPANGSYDIERPGTFIINSPVIKYIESLGFMWGSELNDGDDMCHFEKIMWCSEKKI